MCAPQTAMAMPRADVTAIPAILGHAAPLSTRGYQHAYLTMSRAALARLAEHLT